MGNFKRTATDMEEIERLEQSVKDLVSILDWMEEHWFYSEGETADGEPVTYICLVNDDYMEMLHKIAEKRNVDND